MTRPTKYTPAVVKEICDRLCKGEPLEQICRDDGMPSAQTVHDWTRLLSDNKSKRACVPDTVSKDIARAREIGFDAIANQTRLIAAGVPGISSGDVARDKLMVDTDLKLLAKWHAKKYGDNQQVNVAGSISAAGSIKLEFISPKTIEHEPVKIIDIDTDNRNLPELENKK